MDFAIENANWSTFDLKHWIVVIFEFFNVRLRKVRIMYDF